MPTRSDALAIPFLIVAESSLFDSSRVPGGAHVLWVYGHVTPGVARRPDRGERAQ
ncbi:hypothetical protein [Nonomuraea turcica]|uniref:hypothetical protein n=1 Tax=Nonomuraea sp. G32 TaxID=3067274 RepID=UPI00273C8E97|nr:hypothetical protein [Nonomuraea sp. G32]MDP4509991.1 hypothetical protein [Nonomuraea sp. G32]